MRQSRRHGWGRPETLLVFFLLALTAVLCAGFLPIHDLGPWPAACAAAVFMVGAAAAAVYLARGPGPPRRDPPEGDGGEYPRLAS